MTTLILDRPALTERVTQWAQATNRAADEVLEEAVRAYFDAVEETVIAAETDAFWSAYESIVERYGDGFVAMRDGRVVDHDSDVSRLQVRVCARFGSLPVLIAPLQPPPPHEIHWMGGHAKAEVVY